MLSRSLRFAVLAAISVTPVVAQSVPPVAVDVDVYPTQVGGQSIPDDVDRVVRLDLTRHDANDIAVRTVQGDVFVLAAPGIHQEYVQVASGVTAMAVLPGGGTGGADALVYSDATGIHLLDPSGSTLCNGAASLCSAHRIEVGDCDDDGAPDLIVIDATPVSSPPGTYEDLLVVRNDDGWPIVSSRQFDGEICDLVLMPNWTTQGGSIIHAAVERQDGGITRATVYALSPVSLPTEPYTSFTIPTSAFCVQLEHVVEGSIDRLAVAWTQLDSTSSTGIRSYVSVAVFDPNEAIGAQAGPPVGMREKVLRGMWSGSYILDEYTDLLVGYDGEAYPDLYLNGNRSGNAGTVCHDPGFAACLIMANDPPLAATDFVFEDVDADGLAEFGYATLSSSSDVEVAFAESPVPSAIQRPSIGDCGGHGATFFSMDVTMSQAVADGADAVQVLAWPILWDSAHNGIYISRSAPFESVIGVAPGAPETLTVNGLPLGWESLAYYCVARYGFDDDPAVAGIERWGAPARYRAHGDDLDTTIAGYIPAVEAIAAYVGTCDSGAIPLIIDPIVLPPLPPLPPTPTQTQPPVGN